MWELVNRTRFAAERTFARDRDGAEVLLVVVKATFTIGVGGRLTIADEQVPVHSVPIHSGDPGQSSLLFDTDFALAKQTTDVLLLGCAHTPTGQPSIGLEASIRVGSWSKRIVVVGDRRWESDLTGPWLTSPEPFVSMPLVYERAFGGIDDSDGESTVFEDNPVGVGFSRSGRAVVGRPAPNLEDPSDLVSSPRQRPRPMSFGPIAREWPARRRLAGTFDEHWQRARRPLVPDDFDDAFWQSAPADQRIRIVGGEEVELAGVSPRGVLRFELPRLHFSFRSRLAGKTTAHPSSLHTLLFEPEHDRVVLVFQSALPCHHTIQSLERTIVTEEANAA